MKIGPTHYRYESRTDWDDHTVEIICLRYTVIKETEHTYTIRREGMNWPLDQKHHSDKRVLKHSRRRFAYPTKELAYNSFLIRQVKRQRYLRADLRSVTAVLAHLADHGLPPELDDGMLYGIVGHKAIYIPGEYAQTELEERCCRLESKIHSMRAEIEQLKKSGGEK